MYLTLLLLVVISPITAITLPSSYDVVWDSPGLNHSADSMPVGGGDIGLNTWSENGMSPSMEASGDVALTLQQERSYFTWPRAALSMRTMRSSNWDV